MDIVNEAEKFAELIKESDAVFHLAAAVGVEMVVKNPVHTITTNVHGTENILTAAAKYRKRTIIASTSEVYGKSGNEKFSETDDLLIGSPYNSRWCYASSKLLDEFYLMAFHREADLPGTVVRFFNTVGPRQTGRYGMVIPRFVAQALKNEPLTVYGDGMQSRCFCHVADVVKALVLLLDNKESIGNIYNIGSQELVSIRELAEEVIKRTNSKSEIKAIPYEEAYDKGFEDMRRRFPDTSKIRNLVNWKPEHTLADIIDDVAESMK
jgi:UDP-glucose 4-epimerase